MGAGGKKENNGGDEINYDIVGTFMNVTMYPQ
jgi:hypothetical protein